MTDTFLGGWSTVKHYILNPLADDSDDEKRIDTAENKALKENKEKEKQKEKQKSRNNFSTNVRGYASFNFPYPRQPFRGPASF